MKILRDGTVKGSFKYVTGYTGFNGVETSEQEGHYFPFKIKKKGTKMTFKKNGVPSKENIPFEENNVFRVTKSDTFTVAVDGIDVITFKFNSAEFKEK